MPSGRPRCRWGWMNFLSVQVAATNDAQRIGPRQQAGASSSTFESYDFAAQQCCGWFIDSTVCSRWVTVSSAQLEGVYMRSDVAVGACRGPLMCHSKAKCTRQASRALKTVRQVFEYQITIITQSSVDSIVGKPSCRVVFVVVIDISKS